PHANRFQRWVARSMPRAVFDEVTAVTDTDMAHHLCCALPRAVYEAIGRESDTLETGTDVDLRHRLRGAGYRIVVAPHAVAEHPPPATLRQFLRKQFWYGLGKVELDRLYPPPARNVIRGGRFSVIRYVARALVTAPLRACRHDRGSPWQWNPLRALADLVQKLGYAWAFSRHLREEAVATRPLSSASLVAWLAATRPVAGPVPDPERVRRLLVVATAGLGDALAMLPMLSAVRRHFARACITAWVSRSGAGRVLSGAGVVDRVVIRDLSAATLPGRLVRRGAALVWLRRRRFHLAVVNYINSTDDIALLLRCGGVPDRAGHVADEQQPTLFNLVAPLPAVDSGRQAVRRHLDLLAPLGIARPHDERPRWPVAAPVDAAARELLAASGVAGEAPLIGLHPGCGPDMAWKRWPVERFALLADRLCDAGARILLFGGPEEGELVKAVGTRMSHPSLDMCRVPDLDLTAGLMQHCALVVANDSGLMNLALAVGVPVVAIFGPTPPEVSRPYDNGSSTLAVSRPVDCRPCYDHRRPPRHLACPIGHLCLSAIGVDEVYAACRVVLAGDRPGETALPPAVVAAGPGGALRAAVGRGDRT
ncbi:MAG: glycosyltransferase family 9 protein, partial [Acidobacteriota bacterium]